MRVKSALILLGFIVFSVSTVHAENSDKNYLANCVFDAMPHVGNWKNCVFMEHYSSHELPDLNFLSFAMAGVVFSEYDVVLPATDALPVDLRAKTQGSIVFDGQTIFFHPSDGSANFRIGGVIEKRHQHKSNIGEGVKKIEFSQKAEVSAGFKMKQSLKYGDVHIEYSRAPGENKPCYKYTVQDVVVDERIADEQHETALFSAETQVVIDTTWAPGQCKD